MQIPPFRDWFKGPPEENPKGSSWVDALGATVKKVGQYTIGLFCNPFDCVEEESPIKKVETVKLLKSGPKLLSTVIICNQYPYNAFPGGLVEYKGQLICSFRASNQNPQTGQDGTIAFLTSPDEGKTWTCSAPLTCPGYDLRDPGLSVMPDGTLMLNMGATLWGANNSETLNSAVSFSKDGVNWSPVQVLPYTGQWMWRVTWNKGVAYTGAYAFASPGSSDFKLTLMKSTDGINYTIIKELKIPGSPTEARVRFLPDGTMVALVRRNAGNGWIGVSPYPYENWKWSDSGSVLGGPDFIITPDRKMQAASRAINGDYETTVFAKMTLDSYTPDVDLGDGGDSVDTGYPCILKRGDKSLVTSYSNVSGKYCIYLSTIQL